LGKIQIRASLVPGIHGLSETVLGPEAVEDDSIDGDNNDFDHNLDDAADQ
jgi:hypothetical protein